MTEPSPGSEVVVIMDASGSMRETDQEDSRREAVRAFAERLGPEVRMGLMAFADEPEVLTPLTGLGSRAGRDHVLASVDGVRSRGQFTDITAALERSLDFFDLTRERPRCVILLTDGAIDLPGGESEEAESLAHLRGDVLATCALHRIPVHTVAFSRLAETLTLAEISAVTQGEHHVVTDPGQLHQVLEDLAVAVEQRPMRPPEEETALAVAITQDATVVLLSSQETAVAPDPVSAPVWLTAAVDASAVALGEGIVVEAVVSPEAPGRREMHLRALVTDPQGGIHDLAIPPVDDDRYAALYTATSVLGAHSVTVQAEGTYADGARLSVQTPPVWFEVNAAAVRPQLPPLPDLETPPVLAPRPETVIAAAAPPSPEATATAGADEGAPGVNPLWYVIWASIGTLVILAAGVGYTRWSAGRPSARESLESDIDAIAAEMKSELQEETEAREAQESAKAEEPREEEAKVEEEPVSEPAEEAPAEEKSEAGDDAPDDPLSAENLDALLAAATAATAPITEGEAEEASTPGTEPAATAPAAEEKTEEASATEADPASEIPVQEAEASADESEEKVADEESHPKAEGDTPAADSETEKSDAENPAETLSAAKES